MQLEKMTKIPDLLDIVRLSEKAESCWIKYEYLFHLVKMSDSVFGSLKVRDRSGTDDAEFASCDCDKSDYEHNVYSPSSSSTRWTPEEPPEYFVVAGKKPLSLVFKRSRSNSPVLKSKLCKSPLSSSKLVDSKACSDFEHFGCRRNLGLAEHVPDHNINHIVNSGCACTLKNRMRRQDTCDLERQYLRENFCSVKNSFEGTTDTCKSDKYQLEDKDNKIMDNKIYSCPGLLSGFREINSSEQFFGTESVEKVKCGDRKSISCNSDGDGDEGKVQVDLLKDTDVDASLNCSKTVWNGISSKVSSHEYSFQKAGVQKYVSVEVQDVDMKMPSDAQGMTCAEAVASETDTNDKHFFQSDIFSQNSKNNQSSFESKVCMADMSKTSLEAEIVQSNNVSSPMVINSGKSFHEDFDLQNQKALSFGANVIDDCTGKMNARSSTSVVSELEQSEVAVPSVVNDNACSNKLYTVQNEKSLLYVKDRITGESAVLEDDVEVSEMLHGLHMGKDDTGVIIADGNEAISLKEYVAAKASCLQQDTYEAGDVSLESDVPKTEVSALVLGEIVDMQSSGRQTNCVADSDVYHVVHPVVVPISSEIAFGDVSFPMVCTSVPMLESQTAVEVGHVSESNRMSVVEDCTAAVLAQDDNALCRDDMGMERAGADVEGRDRVESELMEHDSYEAVGSIEVIEHLRNPIDVSPVSVNSDDDLEILEVKGRAAYGNVATASHNLFPWDLEKDGSFSFPGDDLREDGDEMGAGAASLTFSIVGNGAGGRSACSLGESSNSQVGPAYSGLSNDPFICGLSRDSDDVLSPGDCPSEAGMPVAERGEDTESACDRFLFEGKSECSVGIEDGQFLCPVDLSSALPFGEVEEKDDRAFSGIGTADGLPGREAGSSGSRMRTPKTRRDLPRECSKRKGEQQPVSDGGRKAGKKSEQPSRSQKKLSCESTRVYGFSEETMDRIFDDSSGDIYRENSPLLYSSDEEKLYSNVEEEDCRKRRGSSGVSGQCHEKQRLSRLQELVSGVPPPPTVTFPQFCVDTMAERLRGFSLALPKGGAGASRLRTQNSVSEEVAKQTQWPDSKCCFYHGISYNNGRLSEEMELLSQKLCDRYVGSETTSSLVGVPPAPAVGSKGTASTRRSSRDKGHSPGRRLSHLARRRQTFSSSNLLTAPPSDKRVILVDPRPKDRSKSQTTSSKRVAPELTKVSAPSSKASRRSVFQTPPSKGVPDVAKVSVNSSKPTRRALFKSPPAGQSVVSRDHGSPAAAAEASRRALWPATGALHGIENCAKETGKRPRSSGGPEPATSNAKCPRRSSRTPTKGSENRGQADQNDLSSPHRKKLLWAVAESLRAVGIGLQHPRFRTCAATLARLCRDLLLAQPAAPARTGSTSERMLRLANKHVREVVRAQPA